MPNPLRCPLRASAALGSCAALACQPMSYSLRVAEDAASALIAIDDGTLRVHAVEVTDRAVRTDAGPGALEHLHVLTYRWTLSELQLSPGELQRAGTGRPIPTPLEALSIDPSTGRSSPAELPSRLASFLLPSLDLVRCANEGGCLGSIDEAEVACTLPCPTPSVPTPPAAPAPPDQPTAPAPPSLTPCPEGWLQSADAVPTCSPRPAPPLRVCGPDEILVPFTETCAPIGTACPAGEFPESRSFPPASEVLFASPSAAPSGDGSVERPFQTIAAALELARPRTLIVLGKGAFRENVAMTEGVTIFGACVRETIIEGVPTENCCINPVESEAANARIANLTIRGYGVMANRSGSLEISDVAIESQGDRGWGITTENDGSVIGTRMKLVGGPDEAFFAYGGSIEVTDAEVVWGGRGAQVAVGGRVELVRVVMRDTRSRSLTTFLSGYEDGSLAVDSSLFQGSGRMGVELEGVTASVSRSLFELRTEDLASEASAIVLTAGASASFTESVLEGSSARLATATASSLTLRDTVVRDFDHDGLIKLDNSSLELDRVWIHDFVGGAIAALGQSTVGLTDTIIEGSILPSSGDVRPLIDIFDHSSLTLSRVFLSSGSGVWAHGASNLTATDLEVTGQRAIELDDESAGAALSILSAARASVERANLHANAGPGLRLDTSSATISDVRIERGAPLVARSGIVAAAAELTARRVELRADRILLLGSRATLSDLTFESDLDHVLLIAEQGSELAADRVLVRRSTSAVQVTSSSARLSDLVLNAADDGVVANGAELDLTRARITAGAFGVALRNGTHASVRDLEARAFSAAGIALDGSNATLAAAELEAAGGRAVNVVESEIIASDISVTGGTHAVAVGDGGALELRKFALERLEQAAISISSTAHLDRARVQDGDARTSGVGILVPSGLDLAHVLVRVRFADNGAAILK